MTQEEMNGLIGLCGIGGVIAGGFAVDFGFVHGGWSLLSIGVLLIVAVVIQGAADDMPQDQRPKVPPPRDPNAPPPPRPTR